METSMHAAGAAKLPATWGTSRARSFVLWGRWPRGTGRQCRSRGRMRARAEASPGDEAQRASRLASRIHREDVADLPEVVKRQTTGFGGVFEGLNDPTYGVTLFGRRPPGQQSRSAPAPKTAVDKGADKGAGDRRGQATPSAGEMDGIAPKYSYNYITRVRNDLLDFDPSLNQSLISSASTVGQLMTQDSWENHRMSDRYFRHLGSTLTSIVFCRITLPMSVVTFWAGMVWASATFLPPPFAACFVLPSLAAHTLAGGLLSLVLVFRTNSSYARFDEGRRMWGAMLRWVRAAARLGAWVADPTIREKIYQYTEAVAWTSKAHLRSGRTRSDPNDPTAYRDNPEPRLRSIFLDSPEEAMAIVNSSHRPLHCLVELSRHVREAHMFAGLPMQVVHRFEGIIEELEGCIGGCERIFATPVPFSYTRHTSRSIMIFLLTLPFALVPVMGGATVPSVAVLSFLMLGVDEIGIEIEEPFAVLPLHPICIAAGRNVTQIIDLNEAALERRPPVFTPPRQAID